LKKFALLALLAGCAGNSGPTAAPFTLVDQSGNAWSLEAQHGKAVALFFGYTHCTDTCPATLAKLATAFSSAGANASDAEIAFVTVDPQRDTPPVMGRYIARFSGADIVGLTGTPAQIAEVERTYHVWSQRIPGRRGNNDYDEGHTAIVFLIDRTGHIASMPDDSDAVSAISNDVRKVIE